MNHSANSSSTLEYPNVMYAASVITLSLVPPINIYALLLILSGGLETITSEFSCLNLAVSNTLMCFFCLFNVIYVQHGAPNFIRVYSFFAGFLNVSCPLFQGCICLERYLAVVHPVTFLRYKLLRYKIMCCSVVWIITLASCGIFQQMPSVMYKVLLGCYIVLFSLMWFCCVSVLWALKQPGPGEGRTQRAEGYDAKRRAFNIIMITTVVTVISYLPYVVTLTLQDYITKELLRLLFGITLCFNIGQGLCNPLLYLRRAAKLPTLPFDLKRFILIK